MEKNELILEIMNLYDENNALRNANIWLTNQLEAKDVTEAVTGLKEPTHYEYICNVIKEESEKELLKAMFPSWRSGCFCGFDEDTQEYKCTSFKEWLNRKIYDNEPIFEKITKNDFINYFNKELTEMYEQEKQKALEQALIEKEKKESELSN